MLRKLTSDRDGLIDALRRRVMAAGQGLSARDQERLFTVTGLLERIVWMLRRYAGFISAQAEAEAASEIAGRVDAHAHGAGSEQADNAGLSVLNSRPHRRRQRRDAVLPGQDGDADHRHQQHGDDVDESRDKAARPILEISDDERADRRATSDAD